MIHPNVPFPQFRPRRLPRRLLTAMLSAVVVLLAACNSEEPYPSIVSELADGVTDAQGRLTTLVTDDQRQFTFTTPQTDLQPNAIYRGLYGYTLDGDRATLYSFKSAYLLGDSTIKVKRDAVNVVSAWSTPRYINLHLAPKTQGGRHYYGYARLDSTDNHKFLQLHHRQGNDPQSYSDDVFASIAWEEMDVDTVTLTIQTFNGPTTWTFLR
ncbi:MAG: hypothetical protein HUK02_03750 [Bacteroidaceae bacterium]|nr:hypothetical protein [Bacteroidaceae bacterium]